MKSRSTTDVRLPAVAESFYPASPGALTAKLHGFINDAKIPLIKGELIGIIVPHAGYDYSGHVAANAFKLLEGKTFDTVILIGLAHRYPVRGAALYAHGAFRTPLGDIQVDEELATKIFEMDGSLSHLPATHEQEHSIEVQLPFLQIMLSDFLIVPILLQDDSPRNINVLSKAITSAIDKRSLLIVGTTDLCHYPEYSEAVKSDSVIIEAVTHFDTDYLRNTMNDYMDKYKVANLHCMMCSTGAIYTTMEITKALGCDRITLLKAANSGDVLLGAHDQVVGYMAAAIHRSVLD